MAARNNMQALEQDGWTALRRWLRSSYADSILDDLVMGCALAYEVDEILEDHRITPTPVSRKRFGREADLALGEGR